MNVKEYRAEPGYSYSTLKAYLKSPLHGAKQTPFAETAAMRFGTGVDMAMKGDQASIVVSPYDDFRTKEAREWKATNADKFVVSGSDAERIAACAASVSNHLAVREMKLQYMESDPPMFGSIDGIRIKGLPDWAFGGVIVDLKTTSGGVDATSFAKTVDSFHYDLQAAVYTELARQNGEAETQFYWIAVESDNPYDVAVYRATQTILDVGRAKLARALRNVKLAESGFLSGHSTMLTDLEMPAWYGKGWNV